MNLIELSVHVNIVVLPGIIAQNHNQHQNPKIQRIERRLGEAVYWVWPLLMGLSKAIHLFEDWLE